MFLPGPKLLEDLERYFKVVWLDSNGQVNVACPYCSSRGLSPDKSGHLGLNFKINAAHCVRCDWGRRGLRDWLTSLRISGLPSVVSDLRDSKSIKDRLSKPAAEFRHIPARPPRGIFNLDYGNCLLSQSLIRKGISEEEVDRHQLKGCDEFPKYVIFPFFEDGEVVYWQGRHVSPSAKLRKRNPRPEDAPMGKKHWLYGFEQALVGEPLLIVEGQLDAITGTSMLRRETGGHGAALGLSGTSLSFPDAETHPLCTHYGKICWLKPSEIIVMFDLDAYQKSLELANLLSLCGLPARAARLAGYKDLNDAHGDPKAFKESLIKKSRLREALSKL